MRRVYTESFEYRQEKPEVGQKIVVYCKFGTPAKTVTVAGFTGNSVMYVKVEEDNEFYPLSMCFAQ